MCAGIRVLKPLLLENMHTCSLVVNECTDAVNSLFGVASVSDGLRSVYFYDLRVSRHCFYFVEVYAGHMSSVFFTVDQFFFHLETAVSY